jgi:hypothetical protein
MAAQSQRGFHPRQLLSGGEAAKDKHGFLADYVLGLVP